MTEIGIGKHVKYFMRNGMVLEGTIEKDTASECILKSMNGKSNMIIHNPTDDILITKVILEEAEILEDTDITEEKAPKEWLEIQSDLSDKVQEVLHPTHNAELNKMNVEELRRMVQEQERQIITQKKKEHFGTPGAPKRVVQYSNPFAERRSPHQPRRLPKR